MSELEFLQLSVKYTLCSETPSKSAISCCSNKLKELKERYTLQLTGDDMSMAQQKRNKRSEPA